jgi:redox-sensitive bicupin YhaK (pirin superfamily)
MVGDGFRVAQYIPGYGREMSNDTSPFLMLDYNAPWKISPQNGHRPWVGFHPHRGFETVTIVYSWEVEHQDTAWHGGIIGPDEVQWMTAGSGLLHNEFMTERFSLMGWVQHAVQLWVNLPKEYKMTAPRYQALNRENIPEVSFEWWLVRVISWEARLKDALWISLVQKWAAMTFSPVELYDVRFINRGKVQFDLPEGYNAMVLITEGETIVSGKALENGDMLYLSKRVQRWRSNLEIERKFLLWQENLSMKKLLHMDHLWWIPKKKFGRRSRILEMERWDP